tara:strand:- start:645 stop:758 length:114 start_codon:yes stop_codon:yes gene_type:complete
LQEEVAVVLTEVLEVVQGDLENLQEQLQAVIQLLQEE